MDRPLLEPSNGLHKSILDGKASQRIPYCSTSCHMTDQEYTKYLYSFTACFAAGIEYFHLIKEKMVKRYSDRIWAHVVQENQHSNRKAEKRNKNLHTHLVKSYRKELDYFHNRMESIMKQLDNQAESGAMLDEMIDDLVEHLNKSITVNHSSHEHSYQH